MPLSISGIIPVNLSDLHDVSIAAPQTGQYLRYNAGLWQNSYLNADVYNYLNTNLTSTDGITLTKLSGPSTINIGLAPVNATPGPYGSTNDIPVFTVDAQGRITSISSVPNNPVTGTTNTVNTAYGFNALLTNPSGLNTADGNTAIGVDALTANALGFWNTAIGHQSMISNNNGDNNTAVGAASLFSNISGVSNSAFGSDALLSNDTGAFNVAIGADSMQANTSGLQNVAVGTMSMWSNTTAQDNTAVGYVALYSTTTGAQNTGVGKGALYSNTIGTMNVAVGVDALGSNTTGSYNTALGSSVLVTNQGDRNTAAGLQSMYLNTTGSNNTAYGHVSLFSNTTGVYNTAIGDNAMFASISSQNNTAIGATALYNLTSGTSNIALGNNAGASIHTGSANVIIGGNVGATIDGTDQNIIISDGYGNIRIQSDVTGLVTIPGSLTILGTTLLSADPTAALGAATKQYVDNMASGVNVHAACETATTSALAACTYSNGPLSDGVGATLTANTNGALGTIGGYATLVVGSRLLVKNQVASLQNGIYTVTDLGAIGAPWVLTRATDFDGSPTSEISAGDLTYIQEGTLIGTQWVETAIGTGSPGDYIVIGTDAITFTQFSGAGTYTGGTGISVASNVISNTGVTSNVAGTGISVSGATGAVTIANTGVTSIVAGANVAISSATGAVTISTTGTVPSSTTASNIAGGAAGSIPYQTASNTTAMLATGTGVLVGGTTPSYSTTPTLVGTNFSGTASALNIGGNAGTVTNGVYTTSVGTVTNTMLAGSIANAKLLNSSVTIGSTGIQLGSTVTTLSGLTSVAATTFSGSGANLTNIPNTALVGNGNITLGATAMALGDTIPNISGLTSVTATTFTGTLIGNASTATSATTAGAVTTAAQPAITSVGTLTSLAVAGPITTNGLEVGTKIVPLSTQSADYTTTLSDSGSQILHPSADTTARIYTIPANSSVAYPVGTTLTFVNQNAAGVVTIAITTDTMRLAVSGATGSRTLAANGVATAMKIATTEWIIFGSGLS